MITKQEVIDYFVDIRTGVVQEIENILYGDTTHSLTFKQLQEIDHLRTEINKIDDILKFIYEKETI